jgi:hypothetical protein
VRNYAKKAALDRLDDREESAGYVPLALRQERWYFGRVEAKG